MSQPLEFKLKAIKTSRLALTIMKKKKKKVVTKENQPSTVSLNMFQYIGAQATMIVDITKDGIKVDTYGQQI